MGAAAVAAAVAGAVAAAGSHNEAADHKLADTPGRLLLLVKGRSWHRDMSVVLTVQAGRTRQADIAAVMKGTAGLRGRKKAH